jgi:hypothetical protein
VNDASATQHIAGSMYTARTDASSDVVASTNFTKEVRNEDLQFVQNTCLALTVNNIASICAGSFTRAKLESACALITKCSEKRLTKHKGSTDREKRERTK